MMNAIIALLACLLILMSVNITLLFLLSRGFEKTLGSFFIVVSSYGIAPFISGLILYQLLLYLPNQESREYLLLIALFWGMLFWYSRDQMTKLKGLYEAVWSRIWRSFTGKQFVFLGVLSLVTIIFSIQAVFYPISEGDSAYYFLQAKALNQENDANWYNKGEGIFLDGRNEYHYNPMIRPGIPSVFALIFDIVPSYYFEVSSNLFYAYYYYLLLAIFLIAVARLGNSVGDYSYTPVISAFLFFVFYWNMTRFYIFDNKEVAIFFFAILGLLLANIIISAKRRHIETEVLFGVVLGLNAFINFHGVIIGGILALLTFILSNLSLRERILQFLVVSLTVVVSSSFEIFSIFQILLPGVGNYLWHFFESASDNARTLADAKIVQESQDRVRDAHVGMYQVKSFVDVYLKGKIQIITNPVSYGFYFLAFLFLLFSKGKEMWSSVLGRIFILFVLLYYLVVIDPFNINGNPLSVVLWGSPKYSMFVVLLCMAVVSVYFERTAREFSKFFLKNSRVFLTIFGIVLGVFIVLRSSALDFLLGILLQSVQANRPMEFYAGKVSEIYTLGVLGLFVVIVILLATISGIIRKITSMRILVGLCFAFMMAPFFVADPGKVPLDRTFNFLCAGNERKLESTIYFGDLFRVYFFAKESLPPGEMIRTQSLELSVHNEYFQLRGESDKDALYEIVHSSCEEGWYQVHESGPYRLCHLVR